MSWTQLAENRIEEALRAGEFEDLRGCGRPLEMDAYLSSPEEFRAGNLILKNAGMVPPEVDWLRAILDLERATHNDELSEGERARAVADLQLMRTNYQIHRERRHLHR